MFSPKKKFLFLFAELSFGVLTLLPNKAQSDLVAEWDFTPVYTLEREAQNAPGMNDELTKPAPPMFTPAFLSSFQWFGEYPTDGKYDVLENKRIPRDAFSIEIWMLHHVNHPVGAVVGPVRLEDGQWKGWFVGAYDNTFHFGIHGDSKESNMTLLSTQKRDGFHDRLYHAVGTYDGESMKFYLNGELLKQSNHQHGTVLLSSNATFNILAYMQNEPFMKLGNLVRNVWLYDHALDESDVQKRFQYVTQAAMDGRFLREKLHYTAGPILQMVQPHQTTILWETDRPASATIEYGKKLPLSQSIHIEQKSRLHEITLIDLEASTPYFYRITAVDDTQTSDSGVLPFQTAVRKDEPFAFAVIADTEARPFIAYRIANQIWGERPNFVLVNGDLTDDGEEPNRFEWIYEYFAAMTPLYSRVASFPAIGNGESDRVWFRRYHALPQPENYYTFQYGNAQFFMLDTNRDVSPGSEQYTWLENELKKSDAAWKFACHHHPTFSSDDDDYGNTYEGPSTFGDTKVQQLLPLYEKYGIDIVFYGHLHTYERSLPIRNGKVDRKDGIIHIQTGGAGGNLEDMSPTRPWFNYAFVREHHYGFVHIHEHHLDFKMVDMYGCIRDRFSLEK